MDPNEFIADTGFTFDPFSNDLPWPLSWLDNLANRAAAIGGHVDALKHYASQHEWLCAADAALHIVENVPIIGWPLDDGPLAALHWRLCHRALTGHLARHPEDWTPC